MKWLTLLTMLFKSLFKLMWIMLVFGWESLLWIIDLIDGDDDEDSQRQEGTGPYYNYHTGEIDPVQYWNGLYDEDP